MADLIGRADEFAQIQSAIKSKRPELGVLYGRRRVGKSALLRSLLSKNDLYFEGLQQGSQTDQIEHFVHQLAKQTGTFPVKVGSWKEAFEHFSSVIEETNKYVVFDEFPWMANGRTELVSLLKFFWDNHWKEKSSITLVLCGSIAQFMQKHILHSQALHNRKTFEIHLAPLPVSQIRPFLNRRYSALDVARCAMVFGGIPKYLEQIDQKLSLEDNIDKLCFRKNSFFLNEFETLFKEQFRIIHQYEQIVKRLAKGALDLTGIANSLGKSSGGSLALSLKNLEAADFIKQEQSLSLDSGTKSKTNKYVLWDEWLRFYFRFIQPHRKTILINTKPGLFQSLCGSKMPAYYGQSFELLVRKNLAFLFESMNIPLGEIVSFGSYFKQRERLQRDHVRKDGLQLDLVVELRRGRVLLFEIKLTDKPVGCQVIETFEERCSLISPYLSKKSVERILISGAGVTEELEERDYFQRILGLEVLGI